jgi:putative transposase
MTILESEAWRAGFKPARSFSSAPSGGKAKASRGLKPALRVRFLQPGSHHIPEMRIYRRRLPHRDAPGVPVFVTWALWGSLPSERVFLREHLSSGEAFLAWDRLLDAARHGASYLAEPSIASLVVDKLFAVEAGGFCSLDSFVVMPNHVHVLCTPLISLPDLIRRVKGPAALEANRILGRTGHKFWQEEYFDRMVRTEGEAERIRAYIEWNPIKAGLATAPEMFPWSSASRRAGFNPRGASAPLVGRGFKFPGREQG